MLTLSTTHDMNAKQLLTYLCLVRVVYVVVPGQEQTADKQRRTHSLTVPRSLYVLRATTVVWKPFEFLPRRRVGSLNRGQRLQASHTAARCSIDITST